MEGQTLEHLQFPDPLDHSGAISIDERRLAITSRDDFIDDRTLIGPGPARAPDSDREDAPDINDIALHGEHVCIAPSKDRIMAFTRDGYFVRG